MRKQHVLIVIGALLVLGLTGACSSSDTGDLEERVEALEGLQVSASEDAAAVQEQIMRANMVASLDVLDSAGLHEINQAFVEGGEIPSGAGGGVRSALRAVAVAEWPVSLAADAQDLQEKLQAFLDALGDDDYAHQTDTGTAAHDTWHVFSGGAWTFLAESAGLMEGSADGEMDMDME